MSVSDRKLKEKTKRRKDILRAAKKVFLKHGYENSSMDMVAEEVQLSKGALYLYFQSKTELYLSLIEDSLIKIEKTMTEFRNSSESPDIVLLKMAEKYYEFTNMHTEITQMMIDLKDILNSGKVNLEIIHQMKKHEESVFDTTAAIIERGIKEGIFNAQCHPRYSVVLVWIMTMGAIELGRRKSCHNALMNVNVGILIQDIIKTFICSNTDNDEILKKYRAEINSNSMVQSPDFSKIYDISVK